VRVVRQKMWTQDREIFSPNSSIKCNNNNNNNNRLNSPSEEDQNGREERGEYCLRIFSVRRLL
jgi:hypothetical protein